VAMKIRKLAGAGMPFKKVVREVEQFIYQMQTYFVLESLENLRKNGRLTKLQAVVTGALKIKLFMGATPEGEICKLGQALSIKQALSKMVDRMAADPEHEGRTVAIVHCNCLERAFQVKSMVESKCRFANVIISEAGGITTVYANDGGIVVAY
jgi:DegV family protein with EDD domain